MLEGLRERGSMVLDVVYIQRRGLSGVLGSRGFKSKELHGIGPGIDHLRGISPRFRTGVLEGPRERGSMIN